MMDGLREYLFGIIAAAMFCGILERLTSKKESVYALVRLLCGLVLTIALLRPLLGYRLANWELISEMYTVDAEAAAASGSAEAEKATADGIKNALESYILDKAKTLGIDIEIDISLSEQQPMVPVSVCIWGDIPSTAKLELERVLVLELGIAKENLQWME